MQSLTQYPGDQTQTTTQTELTENIEGPNLAADLSNLPFLSHCRKVNEAALDIRVHQLNADAVTHIEALVTAYDPALRRRP